MKATYIMVLLVFLMFISLSAEPLEIGDLVWDESNAGQLVEQAILPAYPVVRYLHLPTYDAYYWILILGMYGQGEMLTQAQQDSIVTFLQQDGYVLVFGIDNLGLIMYDWFHTDIALAITYPISVLTGYGVLQGFIIGYSEWPNNSLCIGDPEGMSEIVLEGDNNWCPMRGTAYQEESDTLCYKTMILNVDPATFNDTNDLQLLLWEIIQEFFDYHIDSVEDDSIQAPTDYFVSKNYPNPFNASTTIVFTLENSSQVSIEVYNIVGQRVVTIHNEFLSSGEHSVVWQAQDQPSGIYFYLVTAGELSIAKKMSLIR